MANDKAAVSLIGRVGKDSELRYSASGGAVANFSMATSSGKREEEETQWWSITMFGAVAERLSQYVRKGDRIAVDGRVKLRQYTTKDGKPGASLEVNADNVFLLGSKNDGPRSANKWNDPDDLPFE